MNVVFTGTMYRTRNEETEKYEAIGLQVKNTVTKSTDFLVQGYNPGRTKIDKAEKYNIPVYTEDNFFSMLKERYPEYFL